MLNQEEKKMLEKTWNRMVSLEKTMSDIIQNPHLDQEIRVEMRTHRDRYRSMKKKIQEVLEFNSTHSIEPEEEEW